MRPRSRGIQAAARQWPRVIAESVGLPVRKLHSGHPPAVAAALPHPEQWNAARFAACWAGHATTLLRVGGLTILTDPHLGSHAGVTLGRYEIGRKRLAALPGSVDDLPAIDLLLLSHAHFDHWDKPTLARLARRFGANQKHPLTVVVPRRTASLLPRGFKNVIELGWDYEAAARDVRVTAIQPKHWGARWVIDRHRGYNSYLIEAAGKRVLFGGDTAHTRAFDHLSQNGGVDLAILGIGASRSWEHLHATPEQAADMAARMGARRLMPIHHGTFLLDNEPLHEPLERLRTAWDARRLVCTNIGELWVGDEHAR